MANEKTPEIPEGKKKFEIKMDQTPDQYMLHNIYIDGELFPFELDEESMDWYHKQKDVHLKRAIEMDIEKFFLESLTEFLNRPITKLDFINALKSGYI